MPKGLTSVASALRLSTIPHAVSTARCGASSEALAFFGLLVRTLIYVDGFNLYYGALKGTPWKWLDLPALCKTILPEHHEIPKVKYSTARVSASNTAFDLLL